MRSPCSGTLWLAGLVTLLAGCGTGNWEISVENQSAAPVSVTVEMGAGNRSATIKDLAAGPPQVLIAEPTKMHLQSVTVIRQDGGEETKQILKPLLELQPGQRYAIVIDKDGKAAAAVR